VNGLGLSNEEKKVGIELLIESLVFQVVYVPAEVDHVGYFLEYPQIQVSEAHRCLGTTPAARDQFERNETK
jgi:hypothetical protein